MASSNQLVMVSPLFLDMQIIAMEDMRVRAAGKLGEVKEIDPTIVKEWDAVIAKENAKEEEQENQMR